MKKLATDLNGQKESTKHEARNSKQYQMTKIQMAKTKTAAKGGSLLLFGILNLCIWDLFRISDFGFRIFNLFCVFRVFRGLFFPQEEQWQRK